jgi:hypothetical protein
MEERSNNGETFGSSWLLCNRIFLVSDVSIRNRETTRAYEFQMLSEGRTSGLYCYFVGSFYHSAYIFSGGSLIRPLGAVSHLQY